MNSPVESGQQAAAVHKRMTQVVIQYLVLAIILFASAGRLDWLWAWVYLGVGFMILVFNSFVLPREVIAERGETKQDVKPWDRTITTITILPSLAIPIVAGLDERFGWSVVLPLAVHLVGLLMFVLGQLLFTWAMASNRFFSLSVTIQLDRSHSVADSGPYRFVRHPGYVGYITFCLGTALLLGSLWALIPALLLTGLIIVRTKLEDESLRQELPGYEEYASTVRSRLLPGIW